jgi:hypothetical protein
VGFVIGNEEVSMKRAGKKAVASGDVAPEITELMIDNSHDLELLDGMLGLLSYDEMYATYSLPVLVLLEETDDPEAEEPTRFAVVSAERTETHYKVRGMSFPCASADGFEGELSLDGSTLTTEGYEAPIVVRFVPRERWTASTLTGLIGQYSGRYEPVDANDQYKVDARTAEKEILKGAALRDAFMALASDDPGHLIGVLDHVSGCYRAHKWGEIRNRHWSGFKASGGTMFTHYTPATEDVQALNREVGNFRASLRRRYGR